MHSIPICMRCGRKNSVKLFGSSSSLRTASDIAGDSKTKSLDQNTILRRIFEEKESYPFSPKAPLKNKVLIDFSSPNIAKPFHAGHLRSTILGNFIANLFEAKGHDVHRINYFGDWGKQCGVVLAALEKFCPSADEEKLSLEDLLQLYVNGTKMENTDPEFAERARNIFADLEQDDCPGSAGKAIHLKRWLRIKEISISAYLELYKRLNIRFDELSGESLYVKDARKIASLLTDPDDSDESPRTSSRLLKSDGGSLYLSRDLAALMDRAERFNFDKMLYVVENGQHDHFQSLFGWAQNFKVLQGRELIHVKFGRIRGLSTRHGNVVLLTDLLDTAKQAMEERIRSSKNMRATNVAETAKILAQSVIIVNDFRERRLHDYENAMNFLQQAEGDSGVFLQYAHARLCSLEKRCGINLDADADFSVLSEEEALALISHLKDAPKTVDFALDELEPFAIVQYLFRNAHLVNKAMKRLQVKNQPEAIGKARLGLFHASRTVASSLMKVLGLKPLEAL